MSSFRPHAQEAAGPAKGTHPGHPFVTRSGSFRGLPRLKRSSVTSSYQREASRGARPRVAAIPPAPAPAPPSWLASRGTRGSRRGGQSPRGPACFGLSRRRAHLRPRPHRRSVSPPAGTHRRTVLADAQAHGEAGALRSGRDELAPALDIGAGLVVASSAQEAVDSRPRRAQSRGGQRDAVYPHRRRAARDGRGAPARCGSRHGVPGRRARTRHRNRAHDRPARFHARRAAKEQWGRVRGRAARARLSLRSAMGALPPHSRLLTPIHRTTPRGRGGHHRRRGRGRARRVARRGCVAP